MNALRRKSLKEALTLLGRSLLIVENVCDQETDVMDNCPENLQGSDRFEAMENAVDKLNDAVDKIEEVKECIESAIGGIG